MSGLTYREQLRRPEWQKKRLEVLEAHGWACASCEAKDKMLHVHHRRYIKGRMAWDYPNENFDALCEDCHLEAHQSKAQIEAILAALPLSRVPLATSLLAGWAHEYIEAGEENESIPLDPACHFAGGLADYLSACDEIYVAELCELISKWPPNRLQVLILAIRQCGAGVQ
jgi:hypothetical protein